MYGEVCFQSRRSLHHVQRGRLVAECGLFFIVYYFLIFP